MAMILSKLLRNYVNITETSAGRVSDNGKVLLGIADEVAHLEEELAAWKDAYAERDRAHNHLIDDKMYLMSKIEQAASLAIALYFHLDKIKATALLGETSD